MNLYNGKITIGQLLQNPNAKKIAEQEFPALLTPTVLYFSKNMTLEQVVQHFGQRLPEQKRRWLLEQLQRA